jgi:hypothetical protein
MQIGTPRGQDDEFPSVALEWSIERPGEFGVPIVGRIPLAEQKSVKWILCCRRIADERVGGVQGNAGGLDTPGRKLHHDQDIVCHQTVPLTTSTVKQWVTANPSQYSLRNCSVVQAGLAASQGWP